MALNTELQNPITQEDIDTYNRDGVVCLRGVLNSEWIKTLLPIAKRLVIEKEDFGLLPAIPGRYMSRCIPEFRKMVFESPIAEACGKILESNEIRFFFDEIFAKPPKSDAKTIWHTDHMGWPTTGEMVPSLWLPITQVKKENCLEIIAGSHHENVPYWLFSPNARKMIKPDDRMPHPECESRRNDGKTKFLSWDMDAGDLLIVHPRALHYSSGNSADDWRVAISFRAFGDDIRWAPRPDCVNLAGVSFDEMIEGEKPMGSHFPVLWSKSGEKDSDENFPRGFATTWAKREMEGVNEYATFKTLKGKENRGELGKPKK
ncbi:phytanoyl-CoA dioxygenase family protein [Aliiglaciecola sp. SL4]|uniref:phytanoyl-CoA dioxygenase family protein n=1 Tax=Aliiglaciecola sp. SL4 TaxID=3239806 RepID=UPI00355C93B7